MYSLYIVESLSKASAAKRLKVCFCIMKCFRITLLQRKITEIVLRGIYLHYSKRIQLKFSNGNLSRLF